MENNTRERICQIMNKLGYNKNSFSNVLGLSNNVTIGNIVNGNRKPSVSIIEKILLTFDSISGDWLLTGKGEMQKVKLHATSTVSDHDNELERENIELKIQLQHCTQERKLLQQRLDTALIEQGRLGGSVEMVREQLRDKEAVVDRCKSETEVLLISNGELKNELRELRYQASEMYQRLQKYSDTDGIEVNSLSA